MIVALVDDNEEERNTTLPLFLKAFHDANVPLARFDFYSSGEEFLENWKLVSYDLIVLDIMMGSITGIDVAREIRNHNQDVRIVFCSSSNEYAHESYKLNASYYIQKPATAEKIQAMIERLNISDFELRRFILLPNEQKLILRNIIYSDYSNHRVTIHQKQGEDIRLWISQTQFQKLLDGYDFLVQCNKGNIINLFEVQDCTKDTFIMNNGDVIPVSRRKQKEMEKLYHDFLFNSLRKEIY